MANSIIQSKPELWGGIECTINRVGNNYRDQLTKLGHYSRKDDDIRVICDLNVKALRYPILWERYQPQPDVDIDWSSATRDLDALRQSGIEPIIGLLHHGSGPSYTELLDRQFPEKFASYAAKVAAQFPHIKYCIPINEPLTTARFSGLYGHWYPHHANDFSFSRMLINQMKGVVLAINSMREIIPELKFIQTEDLCKVHSTPVLAYQADFENCRRWLPYDLLCGAVDNTHQLWNYLVDSGIETEELDFFLNNLCRPDMLGTHYYVTSERFLDERCERYPHLTPGSNNKHTYVDTEAVRTGNASGMSSLLKEIWSRYRIPIVVTEAHLACTREEQMRWFKYIWDTCCSLKDEGIPIEAVTAWALFGAYDWNSLLTLEGGYYESGAFDVRGDVRETALAKMLRSIGSTGTFEHPLLDSSGWWDRGTEKNADDGSVRRPLLIVGKTGSLGVAFSKICEARGILCVSLSRDQIDITSEHDVQKIIQETNPWGIVNASGYVRVDEAETQMLECYQVNTLGSQVLASACKINNIPFMTFSCDQVFSGIKGAPYYEYDEVDPVNNYGLTKALSDSFVSATYSRSLVIRTGVFFSPWDRYNFAYRVLDALAKKEKFAVAKDIVISPTYLPHLVNVALDLFIDGATGVWHLANEEGELSWSEFATQLAKRGGYSDRKIVSLHEKDMNWKAKRPSYSALRSSRGTKMPTLSDAIGDYFRQLNS